MRVTFSHLVAAAVLLTLSAIYSSSQIQTVPNEFDPLFTLDVDLNKKVRLDFYTGVEHDPELSSNKWKASAGASIRLKPHWKDRIDDVDRDKHHVLVLGANFEYSRSDKSGAITEENRLTFDATPRYLFGKKSQLLMSDRNRTEFRWVNGAYHFRYRNRLRFERPFKARKTKLTPYISVESYWDSKYDRWSQFRYGGGVQIPVSKIAAFDAYYDRQHCITCSASSQQTNIFGLTLNIHLRRKK